MVKENQMRLIPKIYYSKEILKLIQYYINEGYDSYSALCEIDRQEISAACIHVLGDDAYTALIDHEDFDIVLHHFKQFMKTGKQEYAVDMAVTMSKNAIEYFEEDMNNLFAEKINEYEWDTNFEAGLKPMKDQMTGETIWL